MTERTSGPDLVTIGSRLPTDKKSVSNTILADPDTAAKIRSTAKIEFTYAPSVAKKPITPYLGPADPKTLEAFLLTSKPQLLIYPSFSASIIQRSNFNPNIHAHPDVFEKIVCPYDAHAFASFLDKHTLTSSYPHLVTNLLKGFPLGIMPNLLETSVLANHPTTLQYVSEVDEYIKKEVAAERTSGPFSRETVERILRGPFQSSPLIVSIQPQGPDEPDKIRICRHLSKSTRNTPSVNSYIPKHHFPTCFDTASRVADIVSSPSSSLQNAFRADSGHPNEGSSFIHSASEGSFFAML